jgi:hypothetical protein
LSLHHASLRAYGTHGAARGRPAADNALLPGAGAELDQTFQERDALSEKIKVRVPGPRPIRVFNRLG